MHGSLVSRVAEVGSLSARTKMFKRNRQARIYYFPDKCFAFARNCKFANLTQYNMQYIPVIVHFLPKEHCFWPKKALFLSKDFQIVRNSGQILLSRQNSVCHPAFKSPCFISSNIEFQPDRVFLFKGCLRIHYQLIAWLGGETFAFCSWHWNIGENVGATYTENTTNHIVNELCFEIKGLREPGFDIALQVFIGAKSAHCLALSLSHRLALSRLEWCNPGK